VAGLSFSLAFPVSTTYKADCKDKAKKLLKMALSTRNSLSDLVQFLSKTADLRH